ncbi:MAG TPA: hypothetical protein VHL80_14795 [Polyangia bacterium]|nr:hypothetical protein [Polyangia bacterium]
MARPSIAALVALGLAGGVGLPGGLGLAGCSGSCCTVDSEPIPVGRAPLGVGTGAGALLARAQPPGGGGAFDMVVDTSSPVTIIAPPATTAPATGTLQIQTRGFDLLDGNTPTNVRARFRDLGLFALPLGPVGAAALVPGGVMGGDLMHAFSMELRFACAGTLADGGAADGAAGDAGAAGGLMGGPACSAVTFWPHQGASLGFLEDAGYAVLRFKLFGGGETTAQSPSDFLGLQAPVTLPATRVVLRACAAPQPFSPDVQPHACCARGDELMTPTNTTGVDLALLLATGVGPMVLTQSAFARVAATLTTAPAMTPGKLLVATWPTAIDAEWTTLPRFALVDGDEPPSTGDEGPCVDLGRARRLEWVAHQTVAAGEMQTPFAPHPPQAACVQGCDLDPSEPSNPLDSAAYVEIGGAIPVAVVDDAEDYLQALRFDIRPEGPDIDGVVGAAALGASRLELDYLNDPPRAIFSCEQNTPREACWAAARCPRLPDHDHLHLCFGLEAHGLPVTCAPSGC